MQTIKKVFVENWKLKLKMSSCSLPLAVPLVAFILYHINWHNPLFNPWLMAINTIVSFIIIIESTVSLALTFSKGDSWWRFSINLWSWSILAITVCSYFSMLCFFANFNPVDAFGFMIVQMTIRFSIYMILSIAFCLEIPLVYKHFCDKDFWDDDMDVISSDEKNCNIRQMRSDEVKELDNFLYEAIYIPEGVAAPDKSIINQPDLQVYVESFGSKEGDICYVAEIENRIVGAAWVRIMDDYGHVGEGIPSWAISLYKEYRGKGIGTKLMSTLLDEIKRRGYKQTSLSVQKENPAWHLYRRMGFEIVDENELEYIMLKHLV